MLSQSVNYTEAGDIELIEFDVQDPIVRLYWLEIFGRYTDRFASEVVSPVQNKLGRLITGPTLRNIIGQPRSTIHLRQILNSRSIFLVDLSKASIGLRDGLVIWANMNRGYRLGEALVAQRVLSADACSCALREQRGSEQRQPLGALLIALGFASAGAVTAEVERVTMDALRETLLWKEGEYFIGTSRITSEGTLGSKMLKASEPALTCGA